MTVTQPPDPPVPSDDARKAAEQERAKAWLEKKWTQPRNCPICGSDQWTVTEVVEIRGFQGGTLVIGGNSGLYPLFQVICNSCGLTHMFNAVLAKVVDA